MPHAIRLYEVGGPEKMRWEEVAVTHPAPGEALVRNTAVGLNFIDTYHRSGLYPVPLPATPCWEAPRSTRSWWRNTPRTMSRP